jgi:hypothetical protein
LIAAGLDRPFSLERVMQSFGLDVRHFFQ